MPIPLSRILDLCGSWICCSRFFPGGCPRIGTLDSRRFGSAWVWHGLRFAGHGVTGPRCGASRTWDYASERSAAKSHVWMPPRRHARLPSTPVDSACAGLGAGVTRRAVASTSGAACTRGSLRAHCRAGGISLRNAPRRNPTRRFQCIQILWNSKPPVERAIHPLPQGTRDLLQYFPRRQLSRDNAKTGHSVLCG